MSKPTTHGDPQNGVMGMVPVAPGSSSVNDEQLLRASALVTRCPVLNALLSRPWTSLTPSVNQTQHL